MMLGIDPKELVPLGISPSDVGAPIRDADARFRAVARDWIEYYYLSQDGFVFHEHWHRVDADVLARAFDRSELFRLWHDSYICSNLDDGVERDEPVAWKIWHSMWRYGCVRDLRRLIGYYDGMRRLDAGLPDFEVQLTWTRSINTAAPAEHSRESGDWLYLDASFGALVHYRGEHVMTIGFATSNKGILVAQVQLRKKKGNRFLFKLPMSYLDFALDVMRRAFPGEEISLVTGASTVAGIQRAYGKSEALDKVTATRIERFYEGELADYVRTGEIVHGCGDDGRKFARLARRKRRVEIGDPAEDASFVLEAAS